MNDHEIAKMERLAENLEYYATDDEYCNVDHNILDDCRRASDVIQYQLTLIQNLIENEQKLREELDEIKGIVR